MFRFETHVYGVWTSLMSIFFLLFLFPPTQHLPTLRTPHPPPSFYVLPPIPHPPTLPPLPKAIWGSKSLSGRRPPSGVSRQKKPWYFSNSFNIIESSSDALDRRKSPVRGAVVGIKLDNLFQKGKSWAKRCFAQILATLSAHKSASRTCFGMFSLTHRNKIGWLRQRSLQIIQEPQNSNKISGAFK